MGARDGPVGPARCIRCDQVRRVISRLPSPVSPQPFRYAERTPSAEAGRLILSYWSFQADTAPPPDEPYTVFPDGCASLACVRTGGGSFVALVGPRVSPLRPPVSAGVRIWGLRLWPDAIAPVLGLSPRGVRDHFGFVPPRARPVCIDLARSLPPSDDPEVVFPALAQFALRLISNAADPDPRVRAAIRAIVSRRGEGALQDVAREAAVGLRHLQRLFPEATGLTLREYARVRRLREALHMRLTRESAGWSHIAAGAGYVDHAHLSREFVALTGLAPTAAAGQLESTTHHDVRP